MNPRTPRIEVIGSVGDRDPIAYGGGFVVRVTDRGRDSTELHWFVPEPEDPLSVEGDADGYEVRRYIIDLEFGQDEWFLEEDHLASVARYAGVDAEQLRSGVLSDDPQVKASYLESFIRYFGPYEFDQYPDREKASFWYRMYRNAYRKDRKAFWV